MQGIESMTFSMPHMRWTMDLEDPPGSLPNLWLCLKEDPTKTTIFVAHTSPPVWRGFWLCFVYRIVLLVLLIL